MRRARRRVTNDPVGLLGDTTSSARTSAGARRIDSMSIVQRPWYSSAYGCAVMPFERRQVFEQRIAGLRNKYTVARIAQQLEQPRVCLAGARGQDDVRGIDVGRRGAVDPRPPPRAPLASRTGAARTSAPRDRRAIRASRAGYGDAAPVGFDSVRSTIGTLPARSSPSARVTALAPACGGTRREITPRSVRRATACTAATRNDP